MCWKVDAHVAWVAYGWKGHDHVDLLGACVAQCPYDVLAAGPRTMLSSTTMTFFPSTTGLMVMISLTISSRLSSVGSMKLLRLPFLRYRSFIKPSSIGIPLSSEYPRAAGRAESGTGITTSALNGYFRARTLPSCRRAS